MNINIIIPMAGESSRFNFQFKPFLFLDNRRFIEHCVDSFLPYNYIIKSYNFIITEQQEKDNNVTNKIKQIFVTIKDKINIIIIHKKTSGPYQTIINGLKNMDKLDNIIICDTDHYVDIEPIINKITEPGYYKDVIIPLWKIYYDDQHNWGKIIVDKSTNSIIKICEKEIIEEDANISIYGMIGCYYFNSTDIIDKDIKYNNISDFLNINYKNLNIDMIKINQALFFGTPEMVKKTIELKRNYETIICDIDGVLIKHTPHSNNNAKDNILISNCIQKLKEWRSDNKKIILMSARPEVQRKECEDMLKEKGIIFDNLILSVNPGTRYLINDIKPTHIFTKQSIDINIVRNKGIDNITCKEYYNNKIKIIKLLKGGSFCQTYLLEEKGKKFVRKYIIKENKTHDHYKKLKRQCEDMKRLYYYDISLVPAVINEEDNRFDYYYDMEFLENYEQLDSFSSVIQQNAMKKIFIKLKENVYCYKKCNDNKSFIEDFFENKIYPKLNSFKDECEIMNYLITSDTIHVNNKPYYGLYKIFHELKIQNFNTEYINPIHGDLTFENILYNEQTDDVKLIDMEGSRYVDSCYFDVGKLFQSLVSKYNEWKDIKEIMLNMDTNNLKCIDSYFTAKFENLDYIIEFYADIMHVKDKEKILKKGIFYMATYFIRFVQFRRKVSKEHGIFAIIMAINWLNYLL